MRYDSKNDEYFGNWNLDERFACWFFASKKDNGLFLSWSRKIREIMKGKQSTKQVSIVDSLTNNLESQKFIKYTLLGPGILDRFFEEYKYYHSNFKYYLWDPREFGILDHWYNKDQYWYLNKNTGKNSNHWQTWLKDGLYDFNNPMASDLRCNFLKLFCAGKSIAKIQEILINNNVKSNENQQKMTIEQILNANLLLSDIFEAAFVNNKQHLKTVAKKSISTTTNTVATAELSLV